MQLGSRLTDLDERLVEAEAVGHENELLALSQALKVSEVCRSFLYLEFL